MTANELMIGDWVAYNGDVDYINPIKIEGMDIATGMCITSDRDDVGFDGVDPIPLTAEILEKNGFNCEEIIQPHWISEDGRILLRNDESLINSNNKWSVHVDNEDMQTIGYFELTYVHQLQHALRLCNIEKEIEI